MTGLPDCMEKMPTADIVDDAINAVIRSGHLEKFSRMMRVDHGESWVLAAALLEAEATIANLKAEVATAHEHLLAGRTLCMDCEGHGTFSVQTGENSYRDEACPTCHGSCFFDAVERINSFSRNVASGAKPDTERELLTLELVKAWSEEQKAGYGGPWYSVLNAVRAIAAHIAKYQER